MAFQAKYLFKRDNTVVIAHPHGANLRVDPDTGNALSNGGKGKHARWNVKLLGDNKIRLQSEETGKYLRIQGGDINVNGGLGGLTIFKVHMVEAPNVVKLESDKNGKYISVKPNGNVNPGGGGKHCVLTFYRNGGGGGGRQHVEAKYQEDSDNENYNPDDDADAEPVKIPEKKEPLGEDAEAVKTWLETIGHSDYVDAFIEAGYDKMETVAMITEEDCDKMGVKPGHTKEIVLAALAAPYLNHWVALRSQHKKRFLATDEGNKKEVELKDEAAKKDARWFIEQSPNGKNLVRLRSTYNSYLRMPGNQDKHMLTVSKEKDIDKRVDLQILPLTEAKKLNVIRIWCPVNANFMTYDDNIMKDRVNSQEESFDSDEFKKQKWEIIVKE